MKPFDPTKPVQTRDGRSARIICFDRKCDNGNTIIALVNNRFNDDESITLYMSSGRMNHINDCESDLINIPEKQTGWLNIYSDNYCFVYNTKDEADKCATKGERIACIQITYFEGEGIAED